jgi:hypothetical protein
MISLTFATVPSARVGDAIGRLSASDTTARAMATAGYSNPAVRHRPQRSPGVRPVRTRRPVFRSCSDRSRKPTKNAHQRLPANRQAKAGISNIRAARRRAHPTTPRSTRDTGSASRHTRSVATIRSAAGWRGLMPEHFRHHGGRRPWPQAGLRQQRHEAECRG